MVLYIFLGNAEGSGAALVWNKLLSIFLVVYLKYEKITSTHGA
jgi:hypothetical protein